MANWRLTAMRLFVDLYRLQTLPLAERFFLGCDEVLDTPIFGYTLPTRVSRTGMHRQLCLMRERFIAERYLISDLLETSDVVVDVGANIGYYLLLFESCIGRSGRVVCIEPEPDNLKELYDCIRVNSLNNAEVLEVAVGEEERQVRMQRGLNGGICDDEYLDGFSVQMICLDSLMEFRPTLVKIDIEGFEGQALAGAQKLLKAFAPKLFIEVHPALLRFDYSVADVINLVRPHYSEMRFFKPAAEGSLIEKLEARYWKKGGCQEIPTETNVLESCRSGDLKEPFWMVCR